MSVIFKHWTPDRTFCFQDTRGQRDLRADEEATGGESRKNHISSDRLPRGVETTAGVWSGLLREAHIFIRQWSSPF